MTGSVFEGEDVVQDALLEAYRKLDQFDDTRPVSPWLFRIAHNRCIDFLRAQGSAGSRRRAARCSLLTSGIFSSHAPHTVGGGVQ